MLLFVQYYFASSVSYSIHLSVRRCTHVVAGDVCKLLGEISSKMCAAPNVIVAVIVVGIEGKASLFI